jgi:ABC-type sugar transport system permease subunit
MGSCMASLLRCIVAAVGGMHVFDMLCVSRLHSRRLLVTVVAVVIVVVVALILALALALAIGVCMSRVGRITGACCLCVILWAV